MSPVSQDGIGEDGPFNGLKVASLNEFDLLGRSTGASKGCLHGLDYALLDSVAFFDGPSHQPLCQIALKAVVAQQTPEPLFLRTYFQSGTVSGEFYTCKADFVTE